MKIVFNPVTKLFSLINKVTWDKTTGKPNYDESNFQSVYHKNPRYKDLTESEARKLYENVLSSAASVHRSRKSDPIDAEGNLIYEKVNRGAQTVLANANSGNLSGERTHELLDQYNKQNLIAGRYRYSDKDKDPKFESIQYFGKELPGSLVTELVNYYKPGGSGNKFMHKVENHIPDKTWFDNPNVNKLDVATSSRPIKMVEIDGNRIPYYMSSGSGGKKDVPPKKWYPIFGIDPDTGWLNKTSGQEIVKAYDVPVLKYIKRQLDIHHPYSSEFDKYGMPDRNKYSYNGTALSDYTIKEMNRDMKPTRNNTINTGVNLKNNIDQFKNRIR